MSIAMIFMKNIIDEIGCSTINIFPSTEEIEEAMTSVPLSIGNILILQIDP